MPEALTTLHYRGPALAARLPAVRHQLVAWARRAGMRASDVDDLALACHEAMANVVDHAYGEETGMLDVLATRPHEHLEVTVIDHGRWRAPHPKPGSLGGRGLPLLRMLAHTADIVTTPRGTTVRMTWSLHPVVPR